MVNGRVCTCWRLRPDGTHGPRCDLATTLSDPDGLGEFRVEGGVCLTCGDGVLLSREHIDPERHRAVTECPEWRCPDLSAEDRRDGKTCPDHPCTCNPSSPLDTNERMTMTDYPGLVREFHEAFGHPIAERPTLVSNALGDLRSALIAEEASEYGDALESRDLVEVADALGDLLYVVYGAALVHGLPIGEIFEEIHRSNMSKLGEDGKPIYREDNKVLKGPNFTPPNLREIIERHQLGALRG